METLGGRTGGTSDAGGSGLRGLGWRGALGAPVFWLLLQGGVLLTLCLVSEHFETFPADIDSYIGTMEQLEYAAADKSLIRELLSNVRTFGYLLFLKGVMLVSPLLDALTFCQ